MAGLRTSGGISRQTGPYSIVKSWRKIPRKRIQEAGGKIHVEQQEVPGMGWFSLFTDPEGRMMGLWKNAAM